MAAGRALRPTAIATWEDLDPFEFERVRCFVTEAGDRVGRLLAGLSDREIAHAMGLGRDDAEVTTGALLLFGRPQAIRRFVPTHEAAFQVLRGLEVEVNDFFSDPLFRLAEEMFSRFRVRNREEELQFGLVRAAIPAYVDGSRHVGSARAGHGICPLPCTALLKLRPGYVRVRGFEPLQQEQMVLAYVKAHRQITQAQAAELCAIVPAQASRLLRRLANQGKLVRRGERRGSFYERPTQRDR